MNVLLVRGASLAVGAALGGAALSFAQSPNERAGVASMAASAELAALQAELTAEDRSAELQLGDLIEMCRALRSRDARQALVNSEIKERIPAGLKLQLNEYTDATSKLDAMRESLEQNRQRIERTISGQVYLEWVNEVSAASVKFAQDNVVGVKVELAGLQPAAGQRAADGVWVIADSAELTATCRIRPDPGMEWGGGELQWTLSGDGRPVGSDKVQLLGRNDESVPVQARVTLPATGGEKPVEYALTVSVTPAAPQRARISEAGSLRVLLKREAKQLEVPKEKGRDRLDSFVRSRSVEPAAINRLISLYLDGESSADVRQDILWNLDASANPSARNTAGSQRLPSPLRSAAQPPARAGGGNALQLLKQIWAYKASRVNLGVPDATPQSAGAGVAITNPPLSARDPGGGPTLAAKYGQVIELCRSGDGWFAVVLTQDGQMQYRPEIVASAGSAGGLNLPKCPPGTPAVIAIDEGITGADIQSIVRTIGGAASVSLVPSAAWLGTPKWDRTHILLSMFWCTRDQIESISASNVKFKGSQQAYRIGG